MFNPFISLKKADRWAHVLRAFDDIASTGRYSDGQYVLKMEQQMSAVLGGQAAVSVNSRGNALYAAYRYYYSKGHRHIAIQNNSFAAVGAMALEAGLTVHLVDSSPDCPAMGVKSLEEVLSTPYAITLVALTHIGGWPAKDYASIANLCRDNEMPLIEDCSSLLGMKEQTHYQPGMWSDCAVWSFQQTAPVPVGGGAVLATANFELRDYVRQFRSYGKTVTSAGVKYSNGLDCRMSEWEAAIASVQLEHLPEIMEARKRDYEQLQSIAPCLMSGPCSYQSYPVEPLVAAQRRTALSLYELKEQLAYCLPSNLTKKTNLVHSTRWAQNHKCLPIGEGLYDNMASKEVELLLKKPLPNSNKVMILPPEEDQRSKTSTQQ